MMNTTTAISPMTKNVLSIAKIQPIAMKPTQMARIAPRIVHIIRPMDPVCARSPGPAVMLTKGPRRLWWRAAASCSLGPARAPRRRLLAPPPPGRAFAAASRIRPPRAAHSRTATPAARGPSPSVSAGHRPPADLDEWGGWGSNPRPANYEASRHLDAFTAAELLKDHCPRT